MTADVAQREYSNIKCYALVFSNIYILVLCPCDARLNKKYFDNIIKFKNK